MKYKGFIGKTEVDEDEGLIYGRVINLTKDVITFAGETVGEAKKDFEQAVDDYLEWAKEEGFEPEKPYQGNILIRADSDLHREAALASANQGKSLNSFVIEAIDEKLHRESREKQEPERIAAADMPGLWYPPAWFESTVMSNAFNWWGHWRNPSPSHLGHLGYQAVFKWEERPQEGFVSATGDTEAHKVSEEAPGAAGTVDAGDAGEKKIIEFKREAI